MSSPPAFGFFLNQDYCYKLAATQITYDAGLAPVRTVEDRIRICSMAADWYILLREINDSREQNFLTFVLNSRKIGDNLM